MNTNSRNVQLFNTPLEIGFRTIFLLNELDPQDCSLERLIIYDYLLLHSGDIVGGPKSLHPTTPHRSSELLVKRKRMQEGLVLMQSKQLIEIIFSDKGFTYKSSNLIKPFLQYFASDYATSLSETAKWVVQTFKTYSDEELDHFIKENLEKWGGEFTRESLVRGDIYE